MLRNNHIYILVMLALLLASCSSTRKLNEGEYMLAKVDINSDGKGLSKDSFRPYVKQKPNSTILGGIKFNLGVYNLSGKDTSRNINKWLQESGEAPVVYDSFLAEQSLKNLELYLQNKGFYNSTITDSVVYKSNKKVKLVYNIETGERYRISDIGIRAEDEEIQNLVKANSDNSYLTEGAPFDVSLHDAERDRVTANLKEQGYFGFSKDNIYFRADTTLGNYQVSDSILITNKRAIDPDQEGLDLQHHVYKIRDVYFRMGANPSEMVKNKEAYLSKFDTIVDNNVYFLYQDKPEVKPEVISSSNYIFPGQMYQASLVNKTRNLLTGLKVYRFVNISFEEVENPEGGDDVKWLKCNVDLVPNLMQSYSLNIEGMNSSGNLGVGGGITYQHKNLLRGAENFDFDFGGSLQNQTNRDGENFSTVEVETGARIVFPKFWMPFKIESFRKRYNPRTSLSLLYNYQRRPDYTRTIANGRISYLWNANDRVAYSLTPFGINYVLIPEVRDEFWDQIEGTYLQYSYQDHLIGGASFSYSYNGQENTNIDRFWYFNFNFSEGGNLFYLIGNSFIDPTDEGYRNILGIRYAQFVKGDVDLRFHHSFNEHNSMAYRAFVGVGFPYGNLDVMPFEERYFSGGANSLRAWPVRGIGPGSYKEEGFTYYNQVGDIKLEFNAEYRFKLFWTLEGALFLDIGNIYNIRDEESQPGGTFEFDNFASKLAFGTGAGLRLDLQYFVFRMDVGLKLKDPAEPEGERWIPANRKYTFDDYAFNFAIGYPF